MLPVTNVSIMPPPPRGPHILEKTKNNSFLTTDSHMETSEQIDVCSRNKDV